jgi:Na+/glutamate symporter
MILNNRADKQLHKFVLYLILANFILIGTYHMSYHSISQFGQMAAGSLLVAYNLMLVKLISQHTHNSNDTYLIYPVVIAVFSLCVSMLYLFFAI